MFQHVLYIHFLVNCSFQVIGSEGCPTIPGTEVLKPGLVAVKLHRSVAADFTTYNAVKWSLKGIYDGVFEDLKDVARPNAQVLSRKGTKSFQEVANTIVDGLVPETFQHFLTKPGSLMYPSQYLQEVLAAIRSKLFSVFLMNSWTIYWRPIC